MNDLMIKGEYQSNNQLHKKNKISFVLGIQSIDAIIDRNDG
jgi:hypothetical protein